MNVEVHSNVINITDVSFFNLKDTLDCGQIFRYEKRNAGFLVRSKDKFCFAEQSNDHIKIETPFTSYFSDFFDLNTDYLERYNQLARFDELSDCAKAACGIRMLKQDAFEMIISFIISANNNIPRIKGIISRICEACGKRDEYGFAFPTQKELCGLTVADFAELGAGYRASYLYEAARTIDDDFLAELKTLDTPLALKKLLTVKGIGPKVADCVALFGLSRGDVFPVDTWMEQTLKTQSLDTNKKIREYYFKRYGGLSGLAQQYIYHYSRNVKPQT